MKATDIQVICNAVCIVILVCHYYWSIIYCIILYGHGAGYNKGIMRVPGISINTGTVRASCLYAA
jgi:hypothetical protein